MEPSKDLYDIVKKLIQLYDQQQYTQQGQQCELITLQKRVTELTSELEKLKTSPHSTNSDPKSAKSMLLKMAIKSSAHGIPNLFSARNNRARISWSICILLSIGFCCFYIYDSFDQFFAFSTITNLKVHDTKEMTFPALIICSWYSGYPVEDTLLFCKFGNRDCRTFGNFDQVRVLGHGLSANRSCIRFNGNKSRLIRVTNFNQFNGLQLGFFLPEQVGIFFFII